MQLVCTNERTKKYRLIWLENGITINCMPLLHMVALFGKEPPVVTFIFDYTNHVSEGVKKDAVYVGRLFKDNDKFDLLSICTDIFFFDGASTVLKASKILCTLNLEILLSWGQECIAIIFSGFVVSKPIKRRPLFVPTSFKH